VLLQVLIGGGGVEDLLAQGFDLGVEVFDAVLPVGDQEVGRGGVLPGGMELVLGLGSELVERRDAACTGADRQGQGIGALPECEGHAVGEFGQDAASTASVLVRDCMASAKRLAALGLITMTSNPASSRASARSR